jgi:dTDP-4-dehydrorhamnose reductase
MEFRELSKAYPSYNFLFASRAELAIEDGQAVREYFSRHAIGICINCAAYTAVDKAESDMPQAIAINATAVGNLAAVCKETGAPFFHFSTDYVFNGLAAAPYKETDDTDPVNFYGKTKLMGEQEAIRQNESSIIIRTSWVYSQFGNNFVKTMLRLMKERKNIGVVADQYGCPTYAADLAAAVMQIISSGKFIAGIYHFCNEGCISWFDFATAIKEYSHSDCIVGAIDTSAYPTPASRPKYSALSTIKIKDLYGIEISDWRDGLQRCIAKMGLS